MNFPIFIIIISLMEWARADSCPEKYTKFAANHTACLPINTNCHFLQMGVSREESSEILHIHNSLRSKVATGRETRAGGMPEASNMMQMEWDDELARIAQILAEQCEPVNNCPACSATENFPVSRIVQTYYSACQENACSRSKQSWNSVIQSVYNLIGIYDSSEVGVHKRGWETLFTQLIWADTWKIGCGYASYLQDKAMTGFEAVHVYICNYGPEGNVGNMPVYKEGQACTSCPLNSCCGNQCKSDGDPSSQIYKGLCKMTSPNTAPVYEDKVKASLFYCNFDLVENENDCYTSVTGVDKWTTTETIMGNIKSIKLRGGEKSELYFAQLIETEGSDICIHLQFREGPAIAGEKHSAKVVLKIEDGEDDSDHSIALPGYHFDTMEIYHPASNYVNLAVKYMVANGSSDSILDIKEVAVFKGHCSEDDEDYEDD